MSLKPTSSTAATSAATFASLPNEVQVSIIATACQDDYSEAAVSGKKALNLMLVSHDVYALTAPLLYKNVKITKPSALADFARTLNSRPALGHLVKALNLGPDRHLPHQWWPLKFLGSDTSLNGLPEIATSIEDPELLPRWCEPRRTWLMETRRDLSRQQAAILAVIRSAESSLDVDLSRDCRSFKCKRIGAVEYLARVMEVQAALDLYLTKLRRLDDEGCSDGAETAVDEQEIESSKAEPGYPPLLLRCSRSCASESSSTKGGHEQSIILEYDNLVQHLARPGGCTDYFDHPLIAARSGLQTASFEDSAEAPSSCVLGIQLSELSDKVANSATLPQTDSAGFLHPNPNSSLLGPAFSPTATVEGLLALARSILGSLPHLETLFLTGFLQQLVCGKAAVRFPASLRSLSLGPLSPWHEDSLSPFAEDGRLDMVEKLYLCGTELAKEKVAAIAALPNLKQADWDLCHNEEPFETVFSALKRLLAVSSLRREPLKSPGSKKRSRASSEEESDDDPEAEEAAEDVWRPKRPHIQVRLFPEHDEALETVLSPKAWAACKASRFVPGAPHPVLFRQVCDSYFDDERWDAASYEVELAYGDIQDRWDFCITGLWYWEM